MSAIPELTRAPTSAGKEADDGALDPAVVAGTAPSGDPSRTTVLVVDDHVLNIELLSLNLERLGYIVTAADGGHAALSRIAFEPPDVVLMDIMMPDLSGLDVLRRLRADPATADLPVILVSGLGETENVVDGLKHGANDYVTKPINMPILQARLAAQSALKKAKDELKRSALLLAAELDRKARELTIAGQVQRSILPGEPPATERLAAAWCYEPVTEIGGDLFDVVPLAGGRTLLFVADAMGHGVQAALVVSTVKATLAAHLDLADDLPRLLGALDAALGNLFEDRFVTAAACVVDPRAGRLHYAIAGHPPILVRGPDGQVHELSEGGLPLGTALGFGFVGDSIALTPGTTILLYSDGLTEAEGPDGLQFGLPALIDLLRTAPADVPGTLAQTIRDAVDGFRGPRLLTDDLTLLAARLLGE